ncbi:MAG TPA: glycosyltransferase [Vicinamibacterales bacterium]|nr:glycosyltransferase [Vicinamibacterales bacterium]
MRLLHVVSSYWPAMRYGGTIVSVHGLCRALAARGHEVHVYTTSVNGATDSAVVHGEATDVDGVKVWYFQSRSLRRLYYAPALQTALRETIRGFDVVHTHAIYLWPLWTAAREARRNGVPYVVSPRGMLEKELIERKSAIWKAALIGFVERGTLEGAAAVHVTSRREADEAEAFGFSLRRISEIPNGVDLDRTAGGASPEIAAAVAGGPYVLFLGRINWKKGLDRLIAAMAHAPGVRLIVAGNDEEGYQPALTSIAQRNGVRDRVIFTGPVHGTDKTSLIDGARALVLPSYSENFGNVVLEAMAAGRPVIISREVGLADLVRDSGAGVIADGAPEMLGDAIAGISRDVRGGDAMGQRGRVAAARYSWDSVAAQMETLYESLRQPARC